jgi:putative flippase GtrA
MRFCATGVLNTALHYAVAMAFLALVMDSPALANGVAFVVATIFSCVVNTLWSFSRRLAGRVFLRFGLVAVLGCGLSMLVAGAAAGLGAPNWLGIFCVVCAVTPVTYLLHRFWTYS